MAEAKANDKKAVDSETFIKTQTRLSSTQWKQCNNSVHFEHRYALQKEQMNASVAVFQEGKTKWEHKSHSGHNAERASQATLDNTVLSEKVCEDAVVWAKE